MFLILNKIIIKITKNIFKLLYKATTKKNIKTKPPETNRKQEKTFIYVNFTYICKVKKIVIALKMKLLVYIKESVTKSYKRE